MTIPPTHSRLPAAGLAVVLAAGAAFAADASPDGTASPVVAPAPPSAQDERGQAQAEFRRLFDAGDYAAAVEQGRRVVELTGRHGARHDEERQAALMNLALAQQRAGDYVGAEASFRGVIELIEASGRMTSPRLARAYAGLGVTYHAARRFDLAAPVLERAIALNRRAEGLFNEEQLPLLAKQADALTEIGRFEDARLAHRYALRIVGRHEGERSPAFVRQLESIGRWYTRVRSFEAARTTLRGAASLAESIGGPEATALVGPLTAIADNARLWLSDPIIRELGSAADQRSSMLHDPMMPMSSSLSPTMIATEGLRALERATAIVDAHPDASPALVAGVHSQLGDWHTARQAPDRARPSYARAWQAAGTAPDGARLQHSLFGTPQLIRYVPPDSWDRYARRPPEEIERLDVEIELTVTADGGVRDARAITGDVDERLTNQALRAAESARYRPRLVDGQPADTPGVRFVQPFYVLREDKPPSQGDGG